MRLRVQPLRVTLEQRPNTAPPRPAKRRYGSNEVGASRCFPPCVQQNRPPQRRIIPMMDVKAFSPTARPRQYLLWSLSAFARIDSWVPVTSPACKPQAHQELWALAIMRCRAAPSHEENPLPQPPGSVGQTVWPVVGAHESVKPDQDKPRCFRRASIWGSRPRKALNASEGSTELPAA